jgi:hypothetical protein
VGLVGSSLGARYALGVGGLAALVAAGYGRLALRRREHQELPVAASRPPDDGALGALTAGPVPALRGAE